MKQLWGMLIGSGWADDGAGDDLGYGVLGRKPQPPLHAVSTVVIQNERETAMATTCLFLDWSIQLAVGASLGEAGKWLGLSTLREKSE